MFTTCLNTYLHQAKNMFTYILNTYFHTVWRYAYFKTFLSNFINVISPWLKICLHLCLKAWLNQVWKQFLHNKWRHYMTQKNFMLKQIQYDTGNLRFTRWLFQSLSLSHDRDPSWGGSPHQKFEKNKLVLKWFLCNFRFFKLMFFFKKN